MVYLRWLVAAACLVRVSCGSAASLYSDQQLAADRERYRPKIEQILAQGLRPFLNSDEASRLGQPVLRFPLRGGDILAVRTSAFDGAMVISVPAMTLRFVEDLSLAYAWRYQRGYSLEPMDLYLVRLRLASSASEDVARWPAPLPALGVPARAWEDDPAVDELSLRFRNTAWAFMLAHEVAHILLGHLRDEAGPAAIQAQEMAADRLAVDLLYRSRTVPMGMILWFQATAGYQRNRADFADADSYQTWLAEEATHPVSGRRLRGLAQAMQALARGEDDGAQAELLDDIALRLDAMGAVIEDDAMQVLLRQCARLLAPADLAAPGGPACR